MNRNTQLTTPMRWLSLVLCILAGFRAHAQPPVCFGPGTGLIYFLQGGIKQYDPAAPVSATNPANNTIPMPASGGGGLAVSTNLNGAGPSPTFYLVGGVTGTYVYWDGTAWINTGHTASAVNPCGAGPYIYSLNGGTGQIYRYDGTGNDVLVATIASFAGGGPFDLAGDNCGNFYVLRMNNTPSPPYLNKYDPTGTLLASYTVTGATPVSSGGGMGIIGNTVYCHNTGGFWIGTIAGTNVNFSLLPGAPAISPSDFGTCALGSVALSPKASIDTAYYCGTGPGIPVSLVGGTPVSVNWSVLSGSATISGSGPSVTITASSDAKILMNATVTDPCGGSGTVIGKDTVTIVVPTATLEAGNNFTIYGCGDYIDTINATLGTNQPWMQYTLAWEPTANIQAGAGSLTPVINPPSNMWFKVTASTKASQGGCTWTDSTFVSIIDAKAEAKFGFKYHFGCDFDTVLFTDSSTSALGALSYYWTFGDNGGGTSNTKNPIWIYTEQNFYQVRLHIANEHCKDTAIKSVDLNHPIFARFTFPDQKICEGDTIQFDASSSIITLPRVPAKYIWNFGDGATDTIVNPVHAYPDAKVYVPTVIVFDSLGCSDTISHTIDNIIPNPYVDLGPEDTLICKHLPLHLPAGISARGDKWVWSDGSEQARKVVNKSGVYIVKLYNECGYGSDTIDIKVKDCTVFFPNAFSPNGDGKNDLAKIIGDLPNVTACEMSIFNRWGERVYYTLSKDEGWDGFYKGEPQPMGSYYYHVKYTSTGEKYELKGDVILVR